MRRKHLTLLLALSLLLTQTRAALAQSQPAGSPPQPTATTTPATAAAPQQSRSPAPLDKRAEKIRRGVEKIGLSQTITVIMPNEDDLHGTVINIGEQSFQLAEVDLRQTVTVRYADVKKVRSGYAPRPDLFTGQRNSPPKGLRIAAFAALVATLAIPLIALSRID